MCIVLAYGPPGRTTLPQALEGRDHDDIAPGATSRRAAGVFYVVVRATGSARHCQWHSHMITQPEMMDDASASAGKGAVASGCGTASGSSDAVEGRQPEGPLALAAAQRLPGPTRPGPEMTRIVPQPGAGPPGPVTVHTSLRVEDSTEVQPGTVYMHDTLAATSR